MLESLRSIVQEVSAAKDVKVALDTITERVRSVMHTEVCSIYLLDKETDRYVFMATQGLNKDAEGKLSLAKDQGLVGLVVQREEPINLENASSHPDFKFLPDIGEEEFDSFLGAPIIHHRDVLGVLVVQQRDSRRFDEAEESFLVTIAAQLSGVIAHAQVTGTLAPFGQYSKTNKDVRFQGVAGCSGVAMGKALVVSQNTDLAATPQRSCDDVEEETDLFLASLDAVKADLSQLKERFVDRLAQQELMLFDVYQQMLDDKSFIDQVVIKIRQGQWAQGALSEVIMAQVETFELMDDDYLRERSIDVKDMGIRILHHLQNAEPEHREIDEQVILLGEELTASMLGEVPRDKLAGLISVRGSSNSHVAILARSMGIPTVMGASGVPVKKLDGKTVIVDGYNGMVIANASEAMQSRYYDVLEEEKLAEKGLEQIRDLPSVTLDGVEIPLMVNTGLMTDIGRSIQQGAQGVGLFRTEIPFLLNDRFPSEEEQRVIYKRQLEIFYPLPVVMRTLDIGGDKALPYFPIEEENPFLGWRGIRVTLDHPEIFLVQVRAMLKASMGLDNLRILLPMISNLQELEDAKALVQRAYKEVCEEGCLIEKPQIGVMVEVPSAIYLIKDLAKKVDFLSVGSNDLTQYLLAVDRNNARVAGLYDHYHPAVLRACNDIAVAAKAADTPVSICGELAGDPAAAVLLAAMGYSSLSMNSRAIPKVKSIIRFIEFASAQKILEVVLTLDNSQDIKDYLSRNLDDVGITPIFKPKLDL